MAHVGDPSGETGKERLHEADELQRLFAAGGRKALYRVGRVFPNTEPEKLGRDAVRELLALENGFATWADFLEAPSDEIAFGRKRAHARELEVEFWDWLAMVIVKVSAQPTFGGDAHALGSLLLGEGAARAEAVARAYVQAGLHMPVRSASAALEKSGRRLVKDGERRRRVVASVLDELLRLTSWRDARRECEATAAFRGVDDAAHTASRERSSSGHLRSSAPCSSSTACTHRSIPNATHAVCASSSPMWIAR